MAQGPTQKIEQAHQLARPARKRLLDFLRRPSTRQRRFGDRGSPAGGRRAPESARPGAPRVRGPRGHATARAGERRPAAVVPCCVSASQGVRRVCWPLVLVCVIACCCVLRAVCWCCLLLRAQSALAIHNSTASSPSTCLPGNDYIDYEA